MVLSIGLSQYITKVQSSFDKKLHILHTYGQLFELTEQQTFHSEELLAIQGQLKQQHALGYLPSTVDSLQLAIDNDNSYHSTLHSFDHDFCLQGTLSFNLTHEPKNYDKTFSFQAQLHLKNHTNRLNYYRNLKAYPTRRTMTAFEPLLFFNYHHKNSDMR